MKSDHSKGSTGERFVEATIGMSRKKFYDLVPVFAASHEAAQQERRGSHRHAIIHHASHKTALDTAEKRLFFILYYLKTCPSFDVLGVNFDLSPSHAYDLMILYARVLRRSLENLAVAPQRTLDSFELFRQAIEEYSARHSKSAGFGGRQSVAASLTLQG